MSVTTSDRTLQDGLSIRPPTMRLHGLIARPVVGLLLLVSLTFSWSASDNGNRLYLAAAPYQFNLPVWIAKNVIGLWDRPGVPMSEADRTALLTDYFKTSRAVLKAQSDLQQLTATEDTFAALDAEQRLHEAMLEQQRLAPQAERMIEAMISQYLKEQSITVRVPLVDPFPPVLFSFQEPPNVLIVSPRGNIELHTTILLQPDMTLAEIDKLERTVEAEGYSALVAPIGGVAIFPTLVTLRGDAHSAIQVAAHEWTHQYLFFHPLGQQYWASPEMTTLNETLADFVGDTIANALAPRPKAPTTPRAALVNPPSFDVYAVLRQTRIAVDQMLKEGRTEEAEAYMEKQRRLLVENGLYIRKLNQAYFAFNGSYASSAASVSPIQAQLKMVRSQSPSFAEFLNKVSGIRTIGELNSLVDPQKALAVSTQP